MTERKVVFLFLIPSLVFLIVFYYYPVYSAVKYSFFKWDGVNERFVGLYNFSRMVRDEWFIRSLGNIVILTLIRLMLSLTAPLLGAVLISRVQNPRVRYFYRVAFVIPMVVAFIVLVLMWQFMYEYRIGLINQFFKAVGLDRLIHNWLGEDGTALYAIAFLGFPWITSFNFGLYFLIYSAGLDNIPATMHDAAMIDGANSLERFLHIDLPMLRGQIKIVVILLIINSIQYFVPVLIMTKGGPGTATMLPGLVMFYNGFKFGNMGYASAIGFTLFSAILVLSWINIKYLKSGVQI